MNLYDDLTARMRPDENDIDFAQFAMRDCRTEMALTPIWFPGKEYGIWDADTVVESGNAGIAVACNNDDSYREAREEVVLYAVKAMGERPGTVGYVVHRVAPDGEPHWSVFEEILPPAKILELASR